MNIKVLGEISYSTKLWQEKTLAELELQKTLAVVRGKAHSLLELMRSHNVLADKTLADWQ